MRLFVHFRTCGQALLREQSVMMLANLDGEVWDMVASGDMITLKTEGTNLSRWTYLLAR